MAKNYTRFKLLTDNYYQRNDSFTINPNSVLSVFSGKIEDKNLAYICNGYTKKYIYFRLNVLLQVNPIVRFLPISLKRIKDPELRNKIKLAREYILLKYE